MEISQLTDDEKAALFYHILYKTHSKNVHPELFGAPFWVGSFYARMTRGEKSLERKGLLDEHCNPTELAFQMLPAENAREMLEELRAESLKLEAARLELEAKVSSLKTKMDQMDPRSSLDRIVIPQQARNYIDKALSRVDEGSYSEAIMNCYRISEILVKTLFNFLYPNEKNKQMKHKDKIKRIWNAEDIEKQKYPGIMVISSLMAVVLWYRNKMGAHTEMTPTKEAARVCVSSSIQALLECNRLGVRIFWQV